MHDAKRARLDRVTMTGADDSVSPRQLATISEEFPFVEWGILLSRSSTGRPRFPSLDWLRELHRIMAPRPAMQLSFHVCGRWVRNICEGNWTPLFCNAPGLTQMIRRARIQLNFHAYTHLLGPKFIPEALQRQKERGFQIIFQCDGVNDHLVSNAIDDGLDAVPLYDKSGGAGISPGEWPRAMTGIYSGYAGGLGPDNLETELAEISKGAQGSRIWVDMETKIRSQNNRQFDLDAVRKCLAIASPHVGGAK